MIKVREEDLSDQSMIRRIYAQSTGNPRRREITEQKPPNFESFRFNGNTSTPWRRIDTPKKPPFKWGSFDDQDGADGVHIIEGKPKKEAEMLHRRSLHNNYIIVDDDGEETKEIPNSPEKSKIPSGTGLKRSDRGRRRQQRMVIADSSEDEGFENTETKKPRRTMIDEDDDFDNNGFIDLHDDVYRVRSSGDPKDVIKDTLKRCEKIADFLRKEIHDGGDKIVTQAEVQAACQMAGARDQMLTPYQLVGVNFLLLLYRKRLGGAILADEMGLGKTIQAITFLALINHLDGDSGPHLIVTPASVLENWQRELQKWCPEFTVIPFHGSERNIRKDELHALARSGNPAPFHVFLTGYSLFERKSLASKDDRSMLRKWNWSCVVMDEAHLLKDRTSYRSKHLKSIAQHAKHRLMITGTPLQNDLQELWSLLEFTMPNIFKDCSFDTILEHKNGRKVVTQDNMDLISHIKHILTPFVLRRVKADVMHQLTPKVHKVECLEMVENQAAAYNEALTGYRAEAKSAMKSGSSLSETIPRRQISSIFTHLRKLANHPLLVRRVYTNQDIEKLASICHRHGIFGDECTVERVKEELTTYNDYRLHQLCRTHKFLSRQIKLTEMDALKSAKCQVLKNLLPELRVAGRRPLIFSQWTQMLDILEWALQVMNLKYNRLDGGTEVSERQSLVDEFNNDSRIFAFLLSTRAGGQGLNLTGADTVIIHDVDFNPQMDRQAEDRCHRIGQTKSVTIYRLVTKATVDESIYAIAQRKLILDTVLEGQVSASSGNDDGNEAQTMGQILSALLSSDN